MAQVFLSYDREDAPKAKAIAQSLERAGHSVWWDRHIRGGAQYSKEIEQALNQADAVVVLWSSHSIDSAWVRDEAAAGRDTGRLVPISLDGAEPPMGFRQFQTINMKGWKGRGSMPRFSEVLHAVECLQGEHIERPRTPAIKPAISTMSKVSFRWAVLAAALLVVIGGVYFLVSSVGRSDVRAVAVRAADPAREPFAQSLLSNLQNLRAIQTGAVRLFGKGGDEQPELIFEARAAGNEDDTNVVLIHGEDGAILWSKEFRLGSANQSDFMLHATYTTGQVLGCALDSLQPGRKSLNERILKLYLSGCSQFAEGNDETRESAIPVFEQVVSEAPRFAAAWAKLLLAESDAVAQYPTRDRARLRQFIVEARKLNRDMPEATLAELTLLPPNAFAETMRLLDQAKADHPESPAVLGYRSVALASVGRLSEAVEDAKEAVRLNPTSTEALNTYVLSLAYAGRIDAARSELRRAEQLWQGSGRLQELQWAFQLRFGDPKELVNSPRFREANPRLQLYYRTRADPTPANVDRLMSFLQELYRRRGLTVSDITGHAQAYGEFDREDALYDLIARLPPDQDLSTLSAVMFRPSLREFRHDPRFMAVAKRVGVMDYWVKSGNWPDFCFDPDQPYDCKAEAAKLN